MKKIILLILLTVSSVSLVKAQQVYYNVVGAGYLDQSGIWSTFDPVEGEFAMNGNSVKINVPELNFNVSFDLIFVEQLKKENNYFLIYTDLNEVAYSFVTDGQQLVFRMVKDGIGISVLLSKVKLTALDRI